MKSGKKENTGKKKKVKTAREGTQAALKEEAIRRNDGEFRKSGKKVKKRKKKKSKKKKKEKEIVEEVQRARHESVHDESEERQEGEDKQKK